MNFFLDLIYQKGGRGWGQATKIATAVSVYWGSHEVDKESQSINFSVHTSLYFGDVNSVTVFIFVRE